MIIESYPGLFGDLHRSENIFEQSPFSLPLSEAFEVGGCYQHSARTVPNRPLSSVAIISSALASLPNR